MKSMSGSGTSDVPGRQVLLLASLKHDSEGILEYVYGVSLGTPKGLLSGKFRFSSCISDGLVRRE